MMHRIFAYIPALALLALVPACGTSSSSSAPPTGGSGLTVQSISVANGSIWQVNRPIEITFDQPIQFLSVNSGTIHIRDFQGLTAGGLYSQPVDANGQIQANKILFQPTCPTLVDGSDAGFTPGGNGYRLSILGTDQGSAGIHSTSGSALADTTTIDFSTPVSTNPGVLYYDPVAGPPRIRLRGSAGVSAVETSASYVEVAATASGRAYFQFSSVAGQGVLDPADLAIIGDGLPRNHYSIPENQIAFVLHFDQPISPDPANLDRFKVEYFDLVWKPILGRVELVTNCAGTWGGAAVRFTPLGMLPAGTPMRLMLDGGFQDLTGQTTFNSSGSLATVSTTNSTTGSSAPIDSFAGYFWLPGTGTGSLEDPSAIFTEARAEWGYGYIAGIFGTDAKSRARSKWIPLGLGRVTAGGTNPVTTLLFEGTDANGVIETVGNEVESSAAFSAPIPLQGLEPQAVTISRFDLASLGAIYVDQPSLLQRYEIRFSHPVQGTFPPSGLNVLGVVSSGNLVRFELGDGCAGLGDCAPLDLTRTYAGPAGVTILLKPRFFEVRTRFSSNSLSTDARITILFDTTVADANGQPDAAAALSANSGWVTDLASLPSAPRDFVRFEVFFELDVSGDGWAAFDPPPTLRFLNFAFDQRP